MLDSFVHRPAFGMVSTILICGSCSGLGPDGLREECLISECGPLVRRTFCEMGMPMLYVPIKIYPNKRSIWGCVVLVAFFLGLAVAGLVNIEHPGLRFGVVAVCLGGCVVAFISAVAAMTKLPMIKVLDDRFSLYTPFGYAMVRFGEVLAFRKGGLPGLRTLRVTINMSARPRFFSGMGRFLYCLVWMSVANSVAIQGYMLGAELDSIINMLEKRRIAAIRLDAIADYDPTALTGLI